ncbi:peroxiredoxin-like family protein [Candidatus Latescibacterota bacterium]
MKKFRIFFAAAVMFLCSQVYLQAQVSNSAEEIRPLLVGTKIPSGKLITSDGEPLDLNEEIKKKPAVLMFYRGGWCGYCNAQMGQLQEIEDDIVALGYRIFAISPDPTDKLQESIIKHEMKYTLLYDKDLAVSKSFGIVFKLDKSTEKRYLSAKIPLKFDSQIDGHLLPVPAVFLVGTDGVIRFHYVNPSYSVRLDADVLLAAAKAYAEE